MFASARKRLLVAVGVALAIVGLGSIGVVSRLEENDRFCTACHTVPEVTYYNRAQSALAGVTPLDDLSSAHYLAAPADLPSGQPFRCIDCHRGDNSLPHRLTTLGLAARDTAIWLARAEDPAIEKVDIEVPWLLTEGCVGCHADSLLVVGFENHFHNKLPDAYRAWQAGGELALPLEDPEANRPALEEGLQPYETQLACLDCHLAHVHVEGAELSGYLDVENVVFPACVQCHIDADAGPLELVQ